MAGNEKTVFDPGATVRESDMTVLECGAAVSGNGTTMLEAVLSDAFMQADLIISNTSIQKGSTILATYLVESDAIEGGMGSVWRVHHMSWNVDLAMKRPQPKCFSTKKSKADFVHECEAWINLGLHPNIVSCYYVREINGTPSIFSEWMEGGSLESAINSGSLYAGTEAEQKERLLDIAIQFARGLHYAHEAGLIHQDVKPDNVLLSKEGEAKVADFGISRARTLLTMLEGNLTMREPDSAKTTVSPSGAYTPAYCSMEQMDGKALTHRTDIYSWAVSLMEMYLGARPWANGIVAGLSCRNYLSETRIPIPSSLKDLLEHCLESEPENRPYDFTEIEARLFEIYRTETGCTYPRPAPEAAPDTADSLNNRALSFLDLGKPHEAEKLWQKALDVYAANPDAVFNKTVYAWRNGQIDDIIAEGALRRMVQNNPGNMHAQWLLTHFYLERCDYENAESILTHLVHPDKEKLLHRVRLIPKRGDRTWKVDWRNRGRIGFSPDGRLMYFASSHGVETRSAENGDLLSRFEFPQDQQDIYCFSSCGEYVLTGGSEGLSFWEIQTCSRIGFIEEDDLLLIRASYIDAQNVFYHKRDGEFYHYKIANGKLEKGKSLLLAPSTAAAFSPNGERLALTTEDGELRLYATKTGACDGMLPFKEGNIHSSVLFSTDGNSLIAAGFGWRVILWNLKTGSYEKFDRHFADKVLYYEADSGLALTCSTGNIASPKLWDMRTGKCVYTLSTALYSAAPHPSKCCLLSPEYGVLPLPYRSYTPIWSLSRTVSIKERSEEDERFAVLKRTFEESHASEDIAGALRAIDGILELPTHKNSRARQAMNDEAGRYCRVAGMRSFAEHYSISFETQQLNPDFDMAGKLAFFRDRLFDIDTGNTVRTLGTGRHCFSPSGTQLLEQQGKHITIFEAQSGKELHSFDLPVKSQSVEAWARYSESGALLCGGNGLSKDECQLWVCSPGGSNMKMLRYPYYGFRSICSLELNADGSFLLSASEADGAAVLWDVKKGKQARVFSRKNPANGRNQKLVGAVFGADDTVVVAEESAVALYSMQGKRFALYDELFVKIVDFCLTADKRHAIIGARAKKSGKSGVFVLELITGSVVQMLQGRLPLVVRLSPDERYVLTDDGYWSIESGQCLATPFYQYGNPRISPSGSMVLAVNEHGLKAFYIDRIYSFPGFVDWDERVLPYVKRFLALHPVWTENDLEGLYKELEYRGYGYIRPEGVRSKLKEIAAASKPIKNGFNLFGKSK